MKVTVELDELAELFTTAKLSKYRGAELEREKKKNADLAVECERLAKENNNLRCELSTRPTTRELQPVTKTAISAKVAADKAEAGQGEQDDLFAAADREEKARDAAKAEDAVGVAPLALPEPKCVHYKEPYGCDLPEADCTECAACDGTWRECAKFALANPTVDEPKKPGKKNGKGKGKKSSKGGKKNGGKKGGAK